MQTQKQGNFVGLGIAMFLMGRGIDQNLDTAQEFYDAIAAAETVEDLDQAQPGALIAYTAPLQQLPIPGTYVEIGEGYFQLLETAEIYCCAGSATPRWLTQMRGTQGTGGPTFELESKRTYPRVYRLGELGIPFENLILPAPPTRIALDNTQLTARGREEGLTPAPEAYYRGDANPQSPELGDHRLIVKGLPSAETVTYIGSVSPERNAGTPYRFQATPYALTIGKQTRTLNHLLNGNREAALKFFNAEVSSAQEMKRAFDLENLFVFVAFGIGGLACAVPLLEFLRGLSGIGQAVRRYGVVVLVLIAGSLIAVTMLLREMGVSALLATGAVGFAAVAGLAGSHQQHRRTASGAAKALASSAPAVDDTPEALPPPTVDPDRVRQTFRNLVRLALEDDVLDEQENQFLVKWARNRGIEDHEIQALFTEAKGDREHGLEATSYDCFNDLIAVALLDGYLTDKERRALLSFGERLGMSPVQAKATIERLTQSFRASAS